MYREYTGNIIEVNPNGFYDTLMFTPEHPFWTGGDDFLSLEELSEPLALSRVKELSGKDSIDTTEICTNYVDREDFIYPRSSNTKINNEDRKTILSRLKSGASQSEVAKAFNISQAAVSQIYRDCRKPKNSIPRVIRLDYDFGICMGYYASEGSIGAGGRNCDFALDGHVDKTLEYFVEQLSESLRNSIGLSPKLYKKKDSLSVSINSRVFGEVLKYICPGDCYTKFINHDILFSNEEFLKGFIIGIWNGDGHIRSDLATIQLTNRDLINQVKMALSYFGVNSSFLKPKRPETGIIKGKVVNLTQPWKLNVSGSDFHKFKEVFYGSDNLAIPNNRNKFYDDGNSCRYVIDEKTYKPYDGFVYNLEVEEDNSYSTPVATVHNCFAKDSQGFFRRSLIESCVGTDQKPVVLSSGNVFFDPMLIGSPNRRYVMGVDPASEVDKFSIVIVELHEDHRRVVYCWTTTRKDHVERVKAGVVQQDNFYSYCGRKIRELMQLFNIVHIALDSQGGGISVAEALHDSDQLESGELQIWPTINHDKPKDTDVNPGLHILELCQFANYNWYSESNHGMRKDFEDKVLLLPRFDQITIGLSIEADKSRNRLYDTLEDCVLDLEELKNELSLIEITKSNNGRDHWDTPEVKTGVGRKSRLRKDRYSSLLMANMAARIISRQAPPQAYQSYGGFATGGYSKDKPKVDYSGPSWFTEGMKGVY